MKILEFMIDVGFLRFVFIFSLSQISLSNSKKQICKRYVSIFFLIFNIKLWNSVVIQVLL